MSLASKKARRWARRLARVQKMRRMAGLPPHEHPERVVFESKKRRTRSGLYVTTPSGVWL